MDFQEYLDKNNNQQHLIIYYIIKKNPQGLKSVTQIFSFFNQLYIYKWDEHYDTGQRNVPSQKWLNI